ncbi:MAG TPA: protein kinase, partial [Polyangiales bacterium]
RVVPKVIDFGISKMLEGEPTHATRSGITMGTPRYASYEQLIGSRDVDGRTDVYAFGVTLYEALTGRAPFGEAVTFAEQAVRLATQGPTSVRELRPEVPEALEALVLRAIAKERDDRIASMDEFVLSVVPFADPGQYPGPLFVRSLAAARRRSTVADPGLVQAPPVVEVADSVPRDSDPEPRPTVFVNSRRRGLTLMGIGISVMAFALLAMRFEPSPRTRAAMPAEAPRDGGAASPPTLAAPVDVRAAREPALALPPAPSAPRAKRARRATSVAAPTPAVEPTTAPLAPAVMEDTAYQAGRLHKGEF